MRGVDPAGHRVREGTDLTNNNGDGVKGADNAVKGTNNAVKGTNNALKGTDNALKGTDISALHSSISARNSIISALQPSSVPFGWLCIIVRVLNGSNAAKGTDNAFAGTNTSDCRRAPVRHLVQRFFEHIAELDRHVLHPLLQVGNLRVLHRDHLPVAVPVNSVITGTDDRNKETDNLLLGY